MNGLLGGLKMAKPIESMPTLSASQAKQLATYLAETKPNLEAREKLLSEARRATAGLRTKRTD